jgi:hypothetical protein
MIEKSQVITVCSTLLSLESAREVEILHISFSRRVEV